MTTQCDCNCKPAFTMLPIQGFGIAVDSSALPTCQCDGTSGGISYSLEEQWTGKYWIDGKKIYQKTVDTGVLPNATAKYIPHGVLSLDKVLSINGFAIRSENMIGLPYASPTGNNVAVNIDRASQSIAVQPINDGRPYTTSYVTIQYTCTDR